MSIKGYKGFNKDMTCRGYKYEEGKIYEMKENPECCKNGFHFCEYPLDCLNYYQAGKSVFHKVDGKKIKENTFYQLIDGEFVEA